MFNTIVEAGAVGAGAASGYSSGSGSNQMMPFLVAPALQHWILFFWVIKLAWLKITLAD
jgi:hypothetical protein